MYNYRAAPPAPPQTTYTPPKSYSSVQNTTNPDEDWTKISDLAERRRIQNRIAQRNYRKKLKRRIEYLEKRAGSTSPTQERRHPQDALAQDEKGDAVVKKRRSSKPSLGALRIGRPFVSPHVPSAFPSRNDNNGMFSHQSTKQLSASPPPAFAYPPYSTTEIPSAQVPYSQPSTFQSLSAPYPEFSGQPVYLPPPPLPPPLSSSRPGLSSYNSSPVVKHENGIGDEGIGSPFGVSYSSQTPGAGVNAAQSYPESTTYGPFDTSDAFAWSRPSSLPVLSTPSMRPSPSTGLSPPPQIAGC